MEFGISAFYSYFVSLFLLFFTLFTMCCQMLSDVLQTSVDCYLIAYEHSSHQKVHISQPCEIPEKNKQTNGCCFVVRL